MLKRQSPRTKGLYGGKKKALFVNVIQMTKKRKIIILSLSVILILLAVTFVVSHITGSSGTYEDIPDTPSAGKSLLTVASKLRDGEQYFYVDISFSVNNEIWGSAYEQREVQPGQYEIVFGESTGFELEQITINGVQTDSTLVTLSPGDVVSVIAIYTFGENISPTQHTSLTIETKFLYNNLDVYLAAPILVDGAYWGNTYVTQFVNPGQYEITFGEVSGFVFNHLEIDGIMSENNIVVIENNETMVISGIYENTVEILPFVD